MNIRMLIGVMASIALAIPILINWHGWLQLSVAQAQVKLVAAPRGHPHGPSPFGRMPSAAEPAVVSRATEASAAYFAATNLKPFIANAAASPASASYFYATLAIRECEQHQYAMASLPSQQQMHPRRQAAVAGFAQRCSEVTRTDIRQLRKLGDEGLAAGDVGFDAVTPESSPSSWATGTLSGARHHRLIEGLHEARDAGVVWAVARELALASDGLQVAGRVMSEAERSSLPAALMLATCEFGVPCDGSNPLLRWECMASGRCEASSLRELFERSGSLFWLPYTRYTRFDYQVALQLRDEIVRGIAGGDRSVLAYRVALPG